MIPGIMNPANRTPVKSFSSGCARDLHSRKEENSPCAFSGTMKKGAVHMDGSFNG